MNRLILVLNVAEVRTLFEQVVETPTVTVFFSGTFNPGDNMNRICLVNKTFRASLVDEIVDFF